MPCACIDVGSNTTRLLVAEVADGRLEELMTERVFTRIGRSLVEGGCLSAEKVAETARVVAIQVHHARELGARSVVAVATAAIRQAKNRQDLAREVETEAGVPLRVLSDKEEARLAFLGATRTLGRPLDGQVGVVDVGGGSTELAIGTVAGGASWSESFGIGSGLLTDGYLHSDPPTASELEAVRVRVADALEGLEAPPARSAVAVGGSATSLRRLVGEGLERETLERAVRTLSGAPASELAARFSLDPERVRLLPAGIIVLEEVSARLGLPLTIGRGGLREGVILDLVGS